GVTQPPVEPNQYQDVTSRGNKGSRPKEYQLTRDCVAAMENVIMVSWTVHGIPAVRGRFKVLGAGYNPISWLPINPKTNVFEIHPHHRLEYLVMLKVNENFGKTVPVPWLVLAVSFMGWAAGSTSQLPMLKGVNYPYWKTKMRAFLKVADKRVWWLWKMVGVVLYCERSD
uniref:Uncharacterized protein n=1 Tax=Cannabis sativa TaxID=3483 RepID=A0A803QS09_CANSA